MKILLLEPFMGESHKAWAEGYARHSSHAVEVMALPGRHWKWRMHGAAEYFARLYREKHASSPDLLLATDMLDVAGFLALTRDLTAKIPVALYFHENQLAYPWSPEDPDPALQRDNHYAYINYRSALVADQVFWNSSYNMESFLSGLDAMLRAFPDHQELGNVDLIRKKSHLLPLGMDFSFRPIPHLQTSEPPLIIWNHRWEYDKGPELFFETLFELADEGIAFRLAVLGRAYNKAPSIFSVAQKQLETQIVHWSFVEKRQDYQQFLAQGTILPVTARQDFFGASVVEAMYMGCIPLLPNALAYPGHIPGSFHKALLYETATEFKSELRAMLLGNLPIDAQPRTWVQHYGWEQQAPRYDALFAAMTR